MSSPSCCCSFAENDETAFASDSTRRRRPSCRIFVPFAVASIRTRLPSSVFARRTRPARTRLATMRLMVGGRTCSASASSPNDRGPPPSTSTDSADSCAGPMPLSRSRTRSRRSRWMAAECSRSAVRKAGPPRRRFDLTAVIQFS